MNRHFVRALLLPCIVLSLSACGGSGDDVPSATSLPAPTTSAAASTPPDPGPSPFPTSAATATALEATTAPIVAGTFPEPASGTVLYRANPQRTARYEVEPVRETPDVRWQVEVGEQVNSPLLVGEVLFAATNAGALLALDAATGDQLWTIDLGGPVIGAFAYADGTLFIGTRSRGLLAVDTSNGSLFWSSEVRGSVWGEPLVADGVLYIGAGGTLYALDAASGEEIWMAEGEGWCRPTVAEGVAFAGDIAGTFHAFDAASGEELWSFEHDAAVVPEAYWTGAALWEETLVIGNIDTFVYALDRATGEQLWQFEAGDWATADPVIAGGIAYFAIGNHEDGTAQLPFYALDVATGEELWSFTTDGLVVEAATLGEGVIYLPTDSGVIYALE